MTCLISAYQGVSTYTLIITLIPSGIGTWVQAVDSVSYMNLDCRGLRPLGHHGWIITSNGYNACFNNIFNFHFLNSRWACPKWHGKLLDTERSWRCWLTPTNTFKNLLSTNGYIVLSVTQICVVLITVKLLK